MDNYDLALEYYKKILKLKNDHAPSYNNMGFIYEGLNNYEKAIEYFSKAIKLKPDYIVAINNLAQAYTNLGFSYQKVDDYAPAIQHYMKALDISPTHANTHNNLSMSLLKTGDIKNGWKHYEYRNGVDYKYLDSINSSIPDIIKNTYIMYTTSSFFKTPLNQILVR